MFYGLHPIDLRSDLTSMQKEAVDGIAAWAYFPKGKFLPHVDFVVRLWDASTKVLFIIACQVTLSQPCCHNNGTWEFYKEEGHYEAWESGAEGLQVQHRLAWINPHSNASLNLFDFEKLGHVEGDR